MAGDFYQHKTDDELRFLVHNPGFYHADIVASARQELRRRNAPVDAPAPTATTAAVPAAAPAAAVPTAAAPPSQTGPATSSEPDFSASYPTEYAADLPADATAETSAAGRFGRNPGTVGMWLAGAVLLVGTGYLLTRPGGPALSDKAAAEAPELAARPDSARHTLRPLATVPTYVLPDFRAAVERSVAQQLAQVPAAQRRDAEALRQYQGLCRRFWAAETLAEHLTNQVAQGTANPALFDQTNYALDAWRPWQQALLYSYDFGPVMAAHLDRMRRVAELQQQLLPNLPARAEAAAAAAANTAETAAASQTAVPSETAVSETATSETVGAPETAAVPDAATLKTAAASETAAFPEPADDARARAELDDLLAGLLPASPVSGRPYAKLTRRARR